MPENLTKARRDRWCRDVRDIARVADRPSVGTEARIDGREVRFDDRMILRLLAIAEDGAINGDGLRSVPTDSIGGRGSGESPTESAATAGLPGPDDPKPDDWRFHTQRDPVGRLITEALDCVSEMARLSRRFEDRLGRILNAAVVIEAEHAAGTCVVCERPVARNDRDVLHRGRYCGTCNTDWQRSGRPHDVAENRWAEQRRESLRQRGRLYSQTNPTSGHGYGVDDLDELVACGTLPAKSA